MDQSASMNHISRAIKRVDIAKEASKFIINSLSYTDKL